MFERISTGWELSKQSWQVLKLDKELLLFPLMSGIACLLVLASFAVPLWAGGALELLDENQGQAQLQNPVAYVVLFAFYFVNYFVIIFFNSALVACSIIRFKGGNPNLRDGFSAASARLPQILGWALVSATVGLILRVIESRSERVGQIVAGLMGMAWSAVTYFVIPVIVVEQLGPVGAAKRSLAILRRTWGEALSANFGIGVMIFLGMLVAMVPLAFGVMLMSVSVPLGIAFVVVGIVCMLTVSLISSALNMILIGALYLYAAEGTVPAQYDNALFQRAFARK